MRWSVRYVSGKSARAGGPNCRPDMQQRWSLSRRCAVTPRPDVAGLYTRTQLRRRHSGRPERTVDSGCHSDIGRDLGEGERLNSVPAACVLDGCADDGRDTDPFRTSALSPSSYVASIFVYRWRCGPAPMPSRRSANRGGPQVMRAKRSSTNPNVQRAAVGAGNVRGPDHNAKDARMIRTAPTASPHRYDRVAWPRRAVVAALAPPP
jgi:hypothetical protein